jgi:SNF2 family DNA or RNA helicase
MVGDVEFTRKGEKLENLLRLIMETDNSRKFLVFSEYDYMLEQSIAETLRARGIGYGMLKRNIHTINKVVSNFNEGDLRVLLINSAHYWCGMNLPEATDVVIMHKMREGKSYNQVVGRA